MILKCVSRYSSAQGEFEPGAEIHVNDTLGEFLLRDSPSSFEVVKERKPKTTPAESSDRMQREGNTR